MTAQLPAPPGWYLDPARARTRWWDGERWQDEAPDGAAPRTPAPAWGRDLPTGETAASTSTSTPAWLPARHVARGAHAAPETSPLVAATLERPWSSSILATVVVAVVLTVTVPAFRTAPAPPVDGGASARPSAAATGSSSGGTAPTPTQTPPPSSATGTGRPSSGSSSAPGSDVLAETDGDGPQVLAPFTSSGEWRLSYRFDCGALGQPSAFAVYDGAAALVRTQAYTGEDSVLRRTPGTHALRIDTVCAWSIRVVGSAG